MSNTVWDTLNSKIKTGGTYTSGIYVVKDGENYFVGKLENNSFSPIQPEYFGNNPMQLNRANWYFVGENKIATTFDSQDQKRRPAFTQLFKRVITPFAPHIQVKDIQDYGNEQNWGIDAMNHVIQIRKAYVAKVKEQAENPNSGLNKIAETIDENPNLKDVGSNEQVPHEEKYEAKDMRNRVEHAALRNISDFLERIKPYLSENIDPRAFHELTKNDLHIYSEAAKIAHALKRHGWSKDQEAIVDALDDFLNTRAEAQVIGTMDLTTDQRKDILDKFFRQPPTVKKGTIPKASEFGFMPPTHNSLSYLVNQNLSLDSMNQLLATGYKVVFNPNLLNHEGATRYAKQIKGSLAPVMDYDGDGMEDFYIYDKTGKIAVINGHRLKRDDKAVLKRMFYTKYTAKQRKSMGGFKGWLNTVLFQVGPYNWKGERTVRVTDQNWEMLQTLHKMGYLKKKPESLLPKTKKSFSSTVKTHILDSIKSGFKKAFPETVKSAWYLPLNYVRDLLYKIIVGSYMYNMAERRGVLENLIGTINNYNSTKEKQSTKNQVYKLLTQWCSKDTQAKEELENLLNEIVEKYIPNIHIIGVGFILEHTNYLTFLNQTKITDVALNAEVEGGELRTYLNAQKGVWAGQVKYEGQNLFDDCFPRFDQNMYTELLNYYRGILEQLQVTIAPNFQVNTTEYPQFALDGAKTSFTDKYTKYNATEGQRMTLNDIRTQPIKRWEGATAYNADYIAGQQYKEHLARAKSYRN